MMGMLGHGSFGINPIHFQACQNLSESGWNPPT